MRIKQKSSPPDSAAQWNKVADFEEFEDDLEEQRNAERPQEKAAE